MFPGHTRIWPETQRIPQLPPPRIQFHFGHDNKFFAAQPKATNAAALQGPRRPEDTNKLQAVISFN